MCWCALTQHDALAASEPWAAPISLGQRAMQSRSMPPTATFTARVTWWMGAPFVHRQRVGGRAARKGARLQAVYTACCKPWTTSLTAGRRVATRTLSAFHGIGGVFRLPLSPAVSSDGSTATVGYFAGQRSAAWHAVWATVAFHLEWHGLVFAPDAQHVYCILLLLRKKGLCASCYVLVQCAIV